MTDAGPAGIRVAVGAVRARRVRERRGRHPGRAAPRSHRSDRRRSGRPRRGARTGGPCRRSLPSGDPSRASRSDADRRRRTRRRSQSRCASCVATGWRRRTARRPRRRHPGRPRTRFARFTDASSSAAPDRSLPCRSASVRIASHSLASTKSARYAIAPFRFVLGRSGSHPPLTRDRSDHATLIAVQVEPDDRRVGEVAAVQVRARCDRDLRAVAVASSSPLRSPGWRSSQPPAARGGRPKARSDEVWGGVDGGSCEDLPLCGFHRSPRV